MLVPLFLFIVGACAAFGGAWLYCAVVWAGFRRLGARYLVRACAGATTLLACGAVGAALGVGIENGHGGLYNAAAAFVVSVAAFGLPLAAASVALTRTARADGTRRFRSFALAGVAAVVVGPFGCGLAAAIGSLFWR